MSFLDKAMEHMPEPFNGCRSFKVEQKGQYKWKRFTVIMSSGSDIPERKDMRCVNHIICLKMPCE